jgi:hypothetical protein
MMRSESRSLLDLSPTQRLSLIVLDRYLFFLSRRPISQSNRHYASQRISGLRALGQTLQGVSHPRIRPIVRLLKGMQPQNLHEVARRLQITLQPLTQTAPPANFLVINGRVPGRFWSDIGRVLLVTGPAIGIGDEVITFPFPAWIKKANPEVEVVVLSGYRGIWELVRGVDAVHHYHEYFTLVQAVRGVLDFESPELYHVLCEEQRPTRYMELSLGARRGAVVDGRCRTLYRLEVPAAYFGNYYDGFDYLLRVAGLSPEREGWFSVANGSAELLENKLRIYVSPFTSKYDPSPPYWSRLLSELVPDEPARPLDFVLDPGPNLSTWRFALELAQATSALMGKGATCRVAGSQSGRNLPLSGVARELAMAHLVICADSFTAHLAPALGRPTLVLAGPGLRDWRVPAPTSFYFSAEAPLPEIAAGMGQILSHFGAEPVARYFQPALAEAEAGFLESSRALGKRLKERQDGAFQGILDGYHEFQEACREVVARLPFWPPRTRGLLSDHRYDQQLHALEAQEAIMDHQEDVRQYIQNSLQMWQNTNLSKYLHLLERGMVAEHEKPA